MKLLTEEMFVVIVVGIIALSGLFYLKNSEIALAVTGGLLGYLTKSAIDKD